MKSGEAGAPGLDLPGLWYRCVLRVRTVFFFFWIVEPKGCWQIANGNSLTNHQSRGSPAGHKLIPQPNKAAPARAMQLLAPENPIATVR